MLDLEKGRTFVTDAYATSPGRQHIQPCYVVPTRLDCYNPVCVAVYLALRHGPLKADAEFSSFVETFHQITEIGAQP